VCGRREEVLAEHFRCLARVLWLHGAALLICMIELYASLLINLYWLGLAGMGVEESAVVGEIVLTIIAVYFVAFNRPLIADSLTFFVPSGVIILVLGLVHERCKRNVGAIVRKVADGVESEEILMTMLHFRVLPTSLGCFDLSFHNFVKVNHSVKALNFILKLLLPDLRQSSRLSRVSPSISAV
jgi:hypothetical protein